MKAFLLVKGSVCEECECGRGFADVSSSALLGFLKGSPKHFYNEIITSSYEQFHALKQITFDFLKF